MKRMKFFLVFGASILWGAQALNAMSAKENIAGVTASLAKQAFEEKKLEKFDAFVGDTACQIRAAMLIDIFSRTKQWYALTEEERNFLCRCYLLEKDKNLETINRKKIATDLCISDHKARCLIKDYQHKLAHASVNFLRQRAREMCSQDVIDVLSKEKDDGNGRQIVACFPCIKVILQWLQEKKVPVLVSMPKSGIKRVFLGDQAVEITQETPAMVFEGVSDMDAQQFDEAVRRYGITHMLLAVMAQHPQFAGETKNDPIEFGTATQLKDEYEALRKFALEKGCLLESPNKLCVIRHIYATVLGVNSVAHGQ